MANSKTLVLRFGTMSGEKTWNFANVDEEAATTANVKTLMNAMVENGSIYKYPPLTKISAILRVVDEQAYDLSD